MGLHSQSDVSRLGLKCGWAIDDVLPIKQVSLRDESYKYIKKENLTIM